MRLYLIVSLLHWSFPRIEQVCYKFNYVLQENIHSLLVKEYCKS